MFTIDPAAFKSHFIAADRKADPLGNIHHACKRAKDDLPDFVPLHHALEIGSKDLNGNGLMHTKNTLEAFLSIGTFCTLLLSHDIKTVVFMGEVLASAFGRVYTRTGQFSAIQVTEAEFPQHELDELKSSTRQMELVIQHGGPARWSGNMLISSEVNVFGDTLVLNIDSDHCRKIKDTPENTSAPDNRFRLFTDGTQTSRCYEKLECVFAHRYDGTKNDLPTWLTIPWGLRFAPMYIIDQQHAGEVYYANSCHPQDKETLRCELIHIGWMPYRNWVDKGLPLVTGCEMIGVLPNTADQKYFYGTEEKPSADESK